MRSRRAQAGAHWGAILALALGAGGAAHAADAPPTGLVDNPCVGAVDVPPAIRAVLAARYHPEAGKPVPQIDPEQLKAYQASAAEFAKRDWPNLCKYRADNARLAAGPASGRRVVFMGDSITEGWGVADATFFTDGVVNRGISGQTTPQMLVRFEADVIALKPAVVHIMAGTNDIAGNTGPTSADAIRNNIVAMATLARASGAKVILASVPPAAKLFWNPALPPAPPKIAETNAWLKAYAAREGFIYADYHTALATPDGAMKPELTLDGVHPNAKGYEVIEPLARAAIQRALGQKR
jgi:lysophospholipase L1-like esterase